MLSVPPNKTSSQLGLIYVFTGDGKGKTSAALGAAIRALAAGLRVAIIQWYKDPTWGISDHHIDKLLTDTTKSRFQLYPMGRGFYIKSKIAPLKTGQVVVDKTTPTNHQQSAKAALKQAAKVMANVDVLILDEINNAISDKLIGLAAVMDLLDHRGATHLILTGRNASPQIIQSADLVTEMKNTKHPYDQGKPAIKGLDF